MPDLVMCTNKKCTRKESCYRHMAIPEMFQYHDNFKMIKDFENCPLFIEIGDKRIRSEYKD